MDEGQSRRSVSPYHEKCFPPYCDNAQHVDKAMVAKMPREDLEDKYITFADENLELKKQNKNQDRQIQRLQTAIARQDKLDKRSGLTPASMVADQNKVAILEAQNKNLQSKIKVLKQQLMNHSYIHSKEGRISDAKTRQAKSSKDSDLQMPSQTQSAREAKPDRNVAALKMRVAELEDELESQKSKYKAHIAQLEKELSALEKEMGKSGTSVNEQLSETSRQVKDNKELIKLRMQAEKHDAELQELQGKLQAAEEEVEKLQQELTDAKDKADDLEKQLDKERNKSKSVISQASRNTTHMETIRALEEQIRDLQNERDTLKDTNDKLLKLTQTKSEKSILGPKISQLENNLKDKMDELEEKEARIQDLEQQLADAEKAAEEAKKMMKPNPSQLSRPKTPPPTPSNEELDNLRDEVRSLQDTVDGLNRELASLKDEKMGLEDQLSFLRNQLDEAQNELGELRPIAEEHKGCRKSPTPSIASKSGLSYIEDLKDKNQKLEEDLNRALDELDALKPIVEEHKNCQKTPIHSTASKSVQAPVASVVSFKDQVITVEGKPSTLASEGSVHSRKTIDSGRYLALSKQLQDALSDNERLKQELEGRDGDDALKAQNKRLTDELNRALRELAEVKPIADEHTRNCGKKEPTPSYVSKEKTPQPSVASKTKTPSRHATPVQSVTSRAPPLRQDYVSHVSLPPSEHCAQTVDLNDPAQKANLLIVSKHDFETVLMQKKRYSTEVEVVEPIDGKQTLNCKLEICMYDLDIEDKMLEYLSSIQPEPKLYVEWSFVGLDQRTAPMPAERALFYTNVMYYGPLSTEIKNYLNKVEMPIDLYLVRSHGTPLKVAEGSLDMLQAMEQPNRGFMRSVMLRGKDVPSRYALDKAVATIHCSFMLHECCLGDPPFKDQVEVAIGTLYLKNRDGGVVPDHATHIYIEYALLGHCGPDLETDSIPRGEVMKFKHSKKLRVNDENERYLKPMLDDNNPRPLRFTVLAEPCSLTSDTEVETVGHADVNLNEEMIKKDRDLVSSQVPVYSSEGEHLGTLSVTVLGINTLQQVYRGAQMAT